MKTRSTNEIRELFLSYFNGEGHTVVDSSSTVPHGDPTLLFTNAGMNQFKDVFLGREKRNYKRATSSQKCVRAGGKHNDLENVGFTARHHTFFEMLGNFSFGDYFKKEAIRFAWDLITNVFEIPKDRLYVTVFREDDEAAEIWEKQEGVSPDRIFRFDEKDNFWQMGETGPCGPCTEIFYDYDGVPVQTKEEFEEESEKGRIVEFWNLVFMQFNRDENGKLNPLPAPSVDTGMGLERIASVLQGKRSNYETDNFVELIQAIEVASGKSYEKDEALKPSFHVIADHLRAGSFLIADGVLPSNEGRGYVLRRILRRAIRHGKNLGFKGAFFSQLTGKLIELMGDAYPELLDKKKFIDEVLTNEEEKFLKTLGRGLEILNKELSEVSGSILSGDVVFKLYDTYGFPPDLTRVIAEENKIGIDTVGFDREMEAQRERSGHFQGSGDQFAKEVYHEALNQLKSQGISGVHFTGYERLEESSAKLLSILHEGKQIKTLKANEKAVVELVFDKTPFYGESGGQVGDTGVAESLVFHSRVRIKDTQKPIDGLIVMRAVLSQGTSLSVGEEFCLKVDQERRERIVANHSATHLLHSALRLKLGDHVKQAGSLVASDRLRFDYTHFQSTEKKTLSVIEDLVNQKIEESIQNRIEVLPKEKALEKGAIAFFGDKYGDEVRVVSMGDYSVEFCGGTHVKNTSDIGIFKITSDQSISSGVRRIEAMTGDGVLEWYEKKDHQFLEDAQMRASKILSHITESLLKIEGSEELQDEVKPFKDYFNSLSMKVKNLKSISFEEEVKDPLHLIHSLDFERTSLSSEVEQKFNELSDILKKVDRKLQEKELHNATLLLDSWISKGEKLTLKKTPFIWVGEKLDAEDVKQVRDLSEIFLQRVTSGVGVFGAEISGKATLIVCVSKDLAGKEFHAGEILKAVSPCFQGKGGGKPFLAQGGGSNPEGLLEAISQAKSLILEKLN